MALSSFVGWQPDSPLTGNLSSRWGHPGLVPPEAWDPAARRASQRALGQAGLVRAGTQGDMRGGRAGPGAPSGWSQPSLLRPACHPGGTAPRQDVSADARQQAGCWDPSGSFPGCLPSLDFLSKPSQVLSHGCCLTTAFCSPSSWLSVCKEPGKQLLSM